MAQAREDCPRTPNTGKFRQIVHNSFARVDVIVNKRNASLLSLASKDRNAREAHPRWTNDVFGTIRPIIDLLLGSKTSALIETTCLGSSPVEGPQTLRQ